MKRFKGIFAGVAVAAIALTFMLIQLNNFSTDASLRTWGDGLEGYIQSTREQQSSGKPMAMFFYTDWCSNCKELRENILASNEVRQAMEAFHPVKVNPEASPANQALANQFGVIGYPTFLVIQPDGAVSPIRRTAGIVPAQFVEQLSQAKETSG